MKVFKRPVEVATATTLVFIFSVLLSKVYF
jgi:hypothetical protein